MRNADKRDPLDHHEVRITYWLWKRDDERTVARHLADDEKWQAEATIKLPRIWTPEALAKERQMRADSIRVSRPELFYAVEAYAASPEGQADTGEDLIPELERREREAAIRMVEVRAELQRLDTEHAATLGVSREVIDAEWEKVLGEVSLLMDQGQLPDIAFLYHPQLEVLKASVAAPPPPQWVWLPEAAITSHYNFRKLLSGDEWADPVRYYTDRVLYVALLMLLRNKLLLLNETGAAMSVANEADQEIRDIQRRKSRWPNQER